MLILRRGDDYPVETCLLAKMEKPPKSFGNRGLFCYKFFSLYWT